MPLFGQRAPTPDELASYVPAPTRLRVLRADGQRIDLRSRAAGADIAATRQEWMRYAFGYRNQIGELRYALRLRARSVARCRFYVAQARPWPEDPAELDVAPPDPNAPKGAQPDRSAHDLDRQLAADAVHNFGRLPIDANPDGFIARLDENLGTVAEAWVHIDENDVFTVHSVSEITASMDGRVALNTLPGGSTGMRAIDPDTESLLRCWVPDPEYGHLADAPLRSLLDVAEDVILAGKEQRAAARSRVAANGILLMPSTLSLVRARADDDDLDDTVTSDTFMADFTAAMTASLRNEGDASAVVPVVVRGEIEDLKEVRHLHLARADSEQLVARQEAAILRLLRGLDIQPEQVTGVSGQSHWGAWLVDARAVRDQVQPAAETLAACLTQAFLRPALESLGHDPEQVAQVMIAVDVTPLVENPNRGQDARDAHDRDVLSDEALRAALGFDPDDAPDEFELIRRSLTKGRITPTAIPLIVNALNGRLPTADDIDRAANLGKPTPQIVDATPTGPAGQRPVAEPGQVNRPVPEPPTNPGPPALKASAAPDPTAGWSVEVELGRRLAAIDAALTEKITVAADAAVARVLERAGAKVRSAAQRDKAVTASLVGIEPHLITASMGRPAVETFVSIPDLISDGYTRLRGQVTGWVRDAAVQAADTVVDILHVQGDRAQRIRDAVTARLAERADTVWDRLAPALDEAVENNLFPDPAATPQVGESSDALVPAGVVAQALADTVGDVPGDGFATGTVVRGALAQGGAVLLGWEWQYRPEIARGTFDPHKQLDHHRFASWTDPSLATDATTAWVGPFFHPQDHRGCSCGASPLYGIPDPETPMADALAAAHGDPRTILFGEGVPTLDRPPSQAGQDVSDLKARAQAAVDALRAEHITKPRRRR